MKRLLTALLAAAILLAPVAAVAEQEKRVYTIASFEKGLNSHVSPYVAGPSTATTAENVRFNTVFGALSKRNALNNYGSAGSHTINGLHRLYKADGTKKLVAAGSTKLYVGSDTDGTFQTIMTGLTDGKRFQFVTYKDVAIGTNGYDQPVKYDGKTQTTANTDGSRTANELCAELGAPFAELNTGTTLDAAAWYQYKVAFYDGSTYSYSTAKSNPILTGAGVHDITLTDIPLGPPGTTIRYIYRTEGQASQAAVEASTSYFQVDDIPDNTTRTFNDSIADATIAADPAPTWATVSAGINATPPKGSLATVHRERLWIGGNKTYLSDIYWSDEFNPDYFDPADTRPIREDDGDAVTFIKEQLGVLRVGKTNTIQSFYTEDIEANWQASAPFSFVGCPAPYSVANSPNGIFYLARDGVYVFNGSGSQLISDAVTPQIRDILETNFDKSWGMFWKNEYQLAYTSSSSGATENNRVLIYNTVRDAYTLDIKSINCFTSFSSGSDYGTLYMGSSGSDGKIYSEENPTPTLLKNLKSEFDAGTFDDARTIGTETLPEIELSWDMTINSFVGTINAASGIIDRPDTTGTWTSPIYQINATNLGLLYWNEALNSVGDVTWQVRTGVDAAAVAAAAYSAAVSNPNGSDISGTTGNTYIQLRANLSTSSIATTPELFVSDGYLFKMTYSKIGGTGETTINSQWQSGWTDFGSPAGKKMIHRIKVFYRGTSGTLSVRYQNDEGDVDDTFDIDLSQDQTTNTVTYGEDNYKGVGSYKIYTFYPPQNQPTVPDAIGQFFRFTITEGGATTWSIEKIEVLYSPQEIYD